MNIVQLHERVRFWIDVVASTRFEKEDIDNSLNVAISSKVRESYDQNLPMNKSDSFQRVQRLRDELGPIVKKLTEGNGILTTTEGENYALSVQDSVTDYGWMLSLRLKDKNLGKNWHPVYPISFNRKNIIALNPFRRVRILPQSKWYYYEEAGKIIIMNGFEECEDSELHYLANPELVSYGIELDLEKDFVPVGTWIIAVTECSYNSITYPIGSKFQTLPSPTGSATGTGTHSFVDCQLRGTTHEEISRRAAINCLFVAGQFEKGKALREEIMAE